MTVRLSQIKEEWIATRGKGVCIGVSDSGIDYNRTEFKNSLREYKQYGESYNYSSIHGNHICGILFSASNQPGIITGFCPMCTSYIAGVGLKGVESIENLANGLEWLSNFKIDILNLSLACDKNNERIFACLKKMSENGTWIFSSFSEKRLYPWSYDFVNSVGYQMNHLIDFCATPECKSIGLSYKNSAIRGSSVSCALVSGVAGVYRAFNQNGSIDDFKREIDGKDLYIPQISSPNKREYVVLGV